MGVSFLASLTQIQKFWTRCFPHKIDKNSWFKVFLTKKSMNIIPKFQMITWNLEESFIVFEVKLKSKYHSKFQSMFQNLTSEITITQRPWNFKGHQIDLETNESINNTEAPHIKVSKRPQNWWVSLKWSCSLCLNKSSAVWINNKSPMIKSQIRVYFWLWFLEPL